MSERQRYIGRSATTGRARRVIMVLVATLLAAAVTGASAAARADNAFPDSQSILLPRDRPADIVVGTTFGLVSTEDGAASWFLSCENKLTVMMAGGMYALGAPPQNRLYAIADVGTLSSADGGCSWQVAGGDLVSLPKPALPLPIDIFPDPSDRDRVYLLAADQNTDNEVYYVFRSTDGGMKYSGPIYTSAPGVVITGIESAASAPGTVYFTLYHGSPVHPQLGVSNDGGDSWIIRDIEAGVGTAIPRLAAVDPVDANKVFLLLLSPAGLANQYQGIALTTDAGISWTKPLLVPKASLTGFTRLPNEVLLASATVPSPTGDTVDSVLYRSEDGGRTFAPQPLTFHPLGLAQRGGVAFMATKDILDGFALVSSSDSGKTWVARLRFRDINGIKPCVQAACAATCTALVGSFPIFPPERCNARIDGGPAVPPKPSGGCGCEAAAGQRDSWSSVGAASLMALGAIFLGNHRRRPRRAEPLGTECARPRHILLRARRTTG